jgi:predicted metalloprotease with PDZ domain
MPLSAFFRASCLCLIVSLWSASHLRAADPPRPIQLSLDATEAPRKLLHAQLTIPAEPGPLTLYYPKWIHGEHAPNGPIADLSGLTIRAGDRTLPWKRDDEDLYAFHCTVPAGATAIDVTLDYLSAPTKDMTPRLAVLNWYNVLLYPKSRRVRDLSIQAAVTLPAGWKLGTALPVEASEGARTRFQTVSVETLADSPVLCGAYLKEVSLGEADGRPHSMVLAGDSAASVEITPEWQAAYQRLIVEAGALFGTRHYRNYRFLVALSDQFPLFAVEHHECSDNRLPERMFLDDVYHKAAPAWVLAHEYVHSWNGKYRRPAGLATADFQEPMRTRLLWVYEGLTEYLGFVLAARSGLYTAEVSRDNFAQIADWARNQTGRTWRPLEDTAAAAPHLYSARTDWASRRRGVDFYDEGALLWLDVDTLIREKTGGKKSLDDFCRTFHGGTGGVPEVKPYTFEDVVKALNQVVEHDWGPFLERRLNSTSPEPPLDGLARAGWKVVYRDQPGELLKARDSANKTVDLVTAVGLLLKDDGTVVDVVPGKAADRAGVGPGMKLLAVNSRRWTADRLRHAVATTRTGGKLRLLMETNDYFDTLTLEYTDGERYPHLEREPTKPDLLTDIFRPKTGPEK